MSQAAPELGAQRLYIVYPGDFPQASSHNNYLNNHYIGMFCRRGALSQILAGWLFIGNLIISKTIRKRQIETLEN
jgi:hypothetical protein